MVAGASGIGLALVQRLLADGHQVVATTREPAKLTGLRTQYPDHLIADALDITEPQRIDEVVQRAVSALCGLDVVGCCAGYAQVGAAEELPDAQVVRHLETGGARALLEASYKALRRVFAEDWVHGGGLNNSLKRNHLRWSC